MTKLINKSKLTTFTNKLWDKISNSFVSKTLPNNVIGETVFSDGYIEGSTLNYFNNKNSQMHIGHGTGDCFGVPNNSVNAGVHVGRIALAVNPSLIVGSNVNSVVALAVRKRNNEVMEVITRDRQARVYKNPYRSITADKIIYIDINKKFSEEVYFVIGCNGLLWSADTPPRANVYGSDTIPAVGDRLTITDYGYSGRFIIFTGKTSFEELVSQKNDSVSKTKDNILVGKTVLQDGYIDGELYSINNQSATDGAYTNLNTAYSGTANKIIPANKNVTSIIVAVRSSMNVGTIATGVNVGVVRADTNEIIEYVHQNATSTVYENSYPQITASRVVNIPINKSWEQNVYFIIGVNGMLWYSPHGSLQLNKVTGGDSLPSVGHIINNLNRTNYIGKIVVLGEGVSLNTLNNKVDLSQVANEPNKIPRIGEDGRLPASILPPEQNGGIRTVNSQSPVNGNVTVYSENIDISSSNSKKISQALDEKLDKSEVGNSGNNVPRLNNGKLVNSVLPDGLINKNNVNNFTNKNDFDFYSPTVTRDFTIASFGATSTSNRRFELFNNSHYIATLHHKFSDTSKFVSNLIIPIVNAQVGDTVNATYFIFNNNNRVIQAPGFYSTYRVEDIDMVGCKCIRIQINRTFSEIVGFGFSVQPKSVRGTTIGLAYAIDNSASEKVWSSAQTPQNNHDLSSGVSTGRVFPYKITHHTKSELVTRFELEKVTQMYPRNLIGEMKQLSYDAGNSLEDGTNTWLRANGQAINSNDYPSLYEKLHTSRVDADIEVTIPMVNSQVGYYYICAK